MALCYYTWTACVFLSKLVRASMLFICASGCKASLVLSHLSFHSCTVSNPLYTLSQSHHDIHSYLTWLDLAQ